MPGPLIKLDGKYYCGRLCGGCEYCLKPEIRPISADDKNYECPITLHTIENGEKYSICPACKYNFSASAIATIAKDAYERAIPCPLCRAGWSKKDTARQYINCKKAEKKTQWFFWSWFEFSNF